MAKPAVASGETAKVPPGIKRPDSTFRDNLLRKRRTYARYFEAGLEQVNQALRRVQVFRCMELRWVPAVVEVGERRSRWETAADVKVAPGRLELTSGKVSLKECGGKEKQALRKYASTVKARLVERLLKLRKEKERRAALLAERHKTGSSGASVGVETDNPDWAEMLRRRNQEYLADPKSFDRRIKKLGRLDLMNPTRSSSSRQ